MYGKYIAVFIIFCTNTLCAQQPAYFSLGENQLKGVKIFDIIQDFEHNYYFATNEGIIKYDYINYTKLEIKNAKSISFFNLTINNKGDIFFNNLNNQIFRIQKNACALFYELTTAENANLIHLNTDEKGNLLVGCKGILAINSQGKVFAKKLLNTSVFTSYQFNKNTLLYPLSLNDTVILYNDGAFTFKKINTQNFIPKNYNMLQYFDFKDSTYVLDLISKSLYFFDKQKWTLRTLNKSTFFNSSTNARIFVTGNKIWSPSSISGINYSEDNISNVFQKYYSDFFISEVFKDNEGNILLGTFDKGVLVIPDIKTPDVINPNSTDPIISIYADSKYGIFMGSNKGLISQYKANYIQNLSKRSKKPIEGIYGNEYSKYIIYDDEKIKYFNKETKEIKAFMSSSLKDVAFVNANEMYLGTNIGVVKVNLKNNKNIQIQTIKELNFRTYSLAYNTEKKILYSSTSNGLYALTEDGKTEKVLYNKEAIFSEKITHNNGKIYIVNNEYGILAINKNNTITCIKPQLPEQTERLKKILIYNESVIAHSANGLYQLNMQGKIIRQFHSNYGFTSKKVYNFDIVNNELWVSHSGGVQQINLLNNTFDNIIPTVILKEILVNNKSYNTGKAIEFNHSERKFEFIFYSPTIKNRENIKYHYKLIGYDEKWQIQSFANNKITYNALSPGKYTLVLKAENLGKFSKEITYTFTIAKPLYYQWWFLLSIVLLFLMLIFFIYKRQLNIQKQKSKQINELNLSKLTAIQSQMNPHFIFNSLNSIQDLVLQQNAPKAYDSIGKFALLIRKIMHHSEKEFIDIEEELSILNVYLEMELLRLKKDFIYEINSNNLTDIEIPPMLLQPYIENAIKHGLLHKKGEKKLLINMQIKDNVFVCEITDNGIGRKKSAEIKERQNKLYESFSSHSLNKRLAILKNHFGGNFGVQIMDLYDTENNALGTKVIVNAPFKYKF